jgi:hypothetical protein
MEQSKLYCTLTDTELSEKAKHWIDRLIKSGGKEFTMQVPARPNEDTDLILAELEQRFLKYCYENTALQAKCERYEKALTQIEALGEGATILHLRTCKKVANEALSAGDGKKEPSCDEIALDKLASQVLTDNQFELEYQGLCINDKRRYLDNHVNQKEDKL